MVSPWPPSPASQLLERRRNRKCVLLIPMHRHKDSQYMLYFISSWLCPTSCYSFPVQPKRKLDHREEYQVSIITSLNLFLVLLWESESILPDLATSRDSQRFCNVQTKSCFPRMISHTATRGGKKLLQKRNSPTYHITPHISSPASQLWFSKDCMFSIVILTGIQRGSI